MTPTTMNRILKVMVGLAHFIVWCGINEYFPNVVWGQTVPSTSGEASRSSASKVESTFLSQHLEQVKVQMKSLEHRLPPLTAEVQKMINQLQALKIEERPTRPPDKAKQIKYRPPMQRLAQKDPGPLIVCENNRLTVFDVASVPDGIEIDVARRLAERKIAEHLIDLPDEHFGFKVKLTSNSVKQLTLSHELYRKTGEEHRGESVAMIAENDSELRQRMKRFNPRISFVQFAVYSDSHDAFRAARALIWDMEFEVNWRPLAPGEAIRIGPGLGITQ
jgi:hypothetical protein